MKRYAEYKDSGVEWIGDIPVDWSLTKMKYVGEFYNGYAFKSSEWSDEGRLIVRIQNLTSDRGARNYFDGYIDDRHVVRPGDYLFSWSTTLGLFEWKEKEAVVNQHIFKIELNQVMQKRFFYWLIQGIVEELSNKAHGSTMTHLTKDAFGSIPLTRPSNAEQYNILYYLDLKTSLIDSLIEKTERKIELLKEKRTALINQVVTKGLNPDVEMKDSGVDRIGDIPTHWNLKRLSWVARLGSGTTPKSSNSQYYEGGEINWLITGDLNDGKLRDTSKKITRRALEDCRLTFYPSGSVVVAMYGATIGKVSLLEMETTVNQACCVACNYNGILPYFIFYQLLASKSYLVYLGEGGGQPNINQDDVRSLQIACPPINEQEELIRYLHDHVGEIDRAINTEVHRVGLLAEYRQSLISEVVTGKIKVSEGLHHVEL